MKKFILFTCLFFTTTVAALAQLPSFTLGLKGGINYATLKATEDLTDANSILGYQVGAWARVGAASFYLQPELYLGSKGGEFHQETSGNTVNAKGKVRFTTLDIPVLLGTKVGSNNLNLRFMAGPVISFIIDDKTTFEDAFEDVTDFEDYKNEAYGLQAGAGIDLGNISVDLRYEAGLSDVNQSDKYDQKQNLFHLSLGLKLL